MGFFDKTAELLGVPEGGGGLIYEADAGSSFENETAQLIQQIDQVAPEAGQQARVDAPEMSQVQQPPGQPAPGQQPPGQQVAPPDQAGQVAPPPPAPPPPPQVPTTDPKLLELIEKQGKVLEQFASTQSTVSDRVRQQQTEQQRIAEMQSWGMDPRSPQDVRQYYLHKEQEALREQLQQAHQFQEQLRQQATRYSTQQQVEQGLKSKAPHLTAEQVQFYAQRASDEALRSGVPVEQVVDQWARHMAAPPPPSPVPQQPATVPAQTQQPAMPQMDPATMMQFLAQMNGMGTTQPPRSANQDLLAQAERLFGFDRR